ncbi:MAG: hypothetical protein EU536_00790 [Promethearchaeota archaeon]|nr:MAG: hypothetical protein EU536_00790 [Candidatus Lokiarchaeota archaeon]
MTINHNQFPQFEKYCEQCKKYFSSQRMGLEQCQFCQSILKIVLICKTCQRRYTVYKVEPGKKCLTCNMPLKVKYL